MPSERPEHPDGQLTTQVGGEQFADEVLTKVADKTADWTFAFVSGGNDSTTMLELAATSEQIDVDAVVHANTGIGLEATREHVQRECNRHGLAYIEGTNRPQDMSYADMVILNGYPGPNAHTIHQRNLKDRVFDGIYRSFGGEQIWLSGARRYESKSRMERVPHDGIEQEPTNRARATWASPIAELTGSEMREIRRERDVPTNDLAELLDMSGECLCQSFGDFWTLGQVYQVSVELVVALVNLTILAEQYWSEQRAENGQPPYPRQWLIWGHGGLGRPVLSEMAQGSLDDPSDLKPSETEQRAEEALKDDEQADLWSSCSSCVQRQRAIADGE